MFNDTGSTGSMDYAVVWILPARDVVVLRVLNRGGEAAAKASEDAADSLFRMYGLRNRSRSLVRGNSPCVCVRLRENSF